MDIIIRCCERRSFSSASSAAGSSLLHLLVSPPPSVFFFLMKMSCRQDQCHFSRLQVAPQGKRPRSSHSAPPPTHPHTHMLWGIRPKSWPVNLATHRCIWMTAGCGSTRRLRPECCVRISRKLEGSSGLKASPQKEREPGLLWWRIATCNWQQIPNHKLQSGSFCLSCPLKDDCAAAPHQQREEN